MNFQYLQRKNSGFPLLLKLAVLAIAVYLVYLLLKLFALILSAVFLALKTVIIVGLVWLALTTALRFLFGVNIFPWNSSFSRYYRR